MNNRFRKATAIFIIMSMLASLSACSKPKSSESSQSTQSTQSTTTSSSSTTETKTDETEATTKESSAQTEDTGSEDSIKSNYDKGIQALQLGKFQEAQSYFESCGNYGYALDLVNVCKAEREFNAGHFDSAIALYSRVSERAEAPGFGVQAKKANISTRVSLVKLSGTYYPLKNTITMTKYKKKRRIHWWFSTGIWSPQSVTLSYTENTDGTFNIKGYVQYGRFTRYSKKRSGVRKENCTYSFKLNHVTRFPNSLKLAKGTTLTYKNGKFVVNYKKTSKSGKTKIVYKSVVTYKK